ncbi:MAG: hypothetical protein HY770_05515 [Chitinivibrionia bacterium]|nr:hypothetical protein [Chitinivibrionia bacterium]
MAEEKLKLSEELSKMKKEPLLPIEKKLIAYIIVLGVALLILLAWISSAFFKVKP